MNSPWTLPDYWVWRNYTDAWNKANIGTIMGNSMFVALTTVVLTLIAASLCAYIIARENSIIVKGVFWSMIGLIMLPGSILFIPLYVEISKFGLINSYWGVILPLCAFGIPFAVYVLTDYIRLISQEIFDSATIDGCGRFQTFIRIVLPLMITPVQTVFAIQFIGVWNEYLLPLLILQDKDKLLIPTILATFKIGLLTIDYGVAFAAIIISSLPAILIFIFMNRHFVQGLTAGAVKE